MVDPAGPLPSTLGPFDWSVMPSGTDRCWRLSWALLAEQVARLAIDAIVPPRWPPRSRRLSLDPVRASRCRRGVDNYLDSALEGWWGGAAVLADHLIVSPDHPILSDDDRADRLVRDLQSITRRFREAAGSAEMLARDPHDRPEVNEL